MLTKYIKEMIRAPFDVAGNLYKYRQILRQMIISELKGRFAGSIGGLLWNFVNPVLMLIVYL